MAHVEPGDAHDEMRESGRERLEALIRQIQGGADELDAIMACVRRHAEAAGAKVAELKRLRAVAEKLAERLGL